MKQLSIVLVLIMAAFYAGAQDDYTNDEVETIFTKRKSNGGYGAFSLGYSQIAGRDALISGARGAFIFDHSFAIGLGGYGFVNNLDYSSYSHDNPEDRFMLAGGYGGLFIESIIAGTKPVHVSFPILVGMGGIALVENTGWGWEWDIDPYHTGHEYDHDLFFVVEPAVELEFNLTRFFRAAAYASYRFTSEIELYETDDDVLNGFNFGMTFKFGKF
ncbi:hypothetical protein [Maribellus mangrovi]|uniref:hypothetical protein n=1 Tax=Maribellus mangrovi TaxID=3133146 RepID=UPI0030EE5A9D